MISVKSDLPAGQAYTFTVVATDSEGLTATETVEIVTKASVVAPPTFLPSEGITLDHVPVAGETLMQVQATGQGVTYSLGKDAQYFTMDSSTG